MPNPTAYAENVRDLRHRLLNAVAVAALDLPENLDSESEFAQSGGTTPDNWRLRAIAEHLDAILDKFSDVQTSVGLPPGDKPRFQWLLGKGKV
jgi:hypothetical protein